MLETSYPSQVFRGVQFVLFGFNPVTESKVRFKLVNGGGVDVGQYSGSCTHIIVDEIAYDDPVCVAARNDGKTLVTALWVDHSADIGMPVDATSVMYRPLKDLNGIPGAKKLLVCLTGYLRQDRDDIMTMVRLMGARFSKPLVANKVTHLICYKFEGEKYELAKRLGTIKLVNHCWLEDCLKDWVLLPEDKYSKSGYELEMMVAEAKDSEEEAENSMLGQSGGRYIKKSPLSTKFGLANTHGLSKSVREAPNAFPVSVGPQVLLKDHKDSLIIPGDKIVSEQASGFHHVDDQKINCQDPDVSRHATSCQLSETHVMTGKPKNNDVPRTVGCQDLGIIGNVNSSDQLPDLLAGTSESKKSVSDLRSTSAIAEGLAHSDAKVRAMGCQSRKNPRGFTPPRNLDESLGNAIDPSVSPLGDLKFDSNQTSSSKVEKTSEKIKSACVEVSMEGNDFIKGDKPINLLPQKRINEASSTKLKSRKRTADAKLSVEKIPSEKLTLVVDEQPPEIEGNFSAGNDGINNSNICSVSKYSASTSNSLAKASSESAQRDNAYQNSAQTSFQSPSECKINGRPDTTGFTVGLVDGNEAEPHTVTKNLSCSSPDNKKSQYEDSTGLINLDLSNKVNDKLIRKSPRKKSVAKRSLGSRPKFSSTDKQKSSVSLNKTTTQGDGVSFSSGFQEIATADVKKLQASPQIPDVDTLVGQESVSKYAENADGRTEFLDDETEAPDEICENELGIALDEKKSEVAPLLKKADTTTEEKSEAIHHITECEEAMPPKKGTNGTEQQNPPSLGDSTSKVKEKHQARKRPAGRTKKTSSDKNLLKSKAAKSEEKINNERKREAEMETMDEVSLPADIGEDVTAPTNKSESFVEEEKENRPIEGKLDTVEGKSVGNSTIKSSASSAKINSKKTVLSPSTSEDNRRVKSEAVCFILSGHRLQRKEFQQVIRRLKGRVCRDSHQWSYQATHFIAPDPIRRTEKFFAAAASGRWILKTDYLAASSQAGKFMVEEPYEWHKNGLSEDGAINMEAPRKWRLLKERTGHGAFYGMRIIVYGDCIAPSLDTLKRVVKAGDGTIVATSPPYTRFLDTGIDYAIVSPGMPRVDMWVQEFLKHEIPCVVADYLVEYVCKPGFSLERHVLYGTHAWAERSYAKLQCKADEIIEELIPPPKDSPDDKDTICQVCRSRDRGDVMLICGDESGSVGCGVGTHIDCCDPPLTEVPKEDWFCPKCTRTRNCSKSPKKRKKGASSSSNSK